MRRALLAASVAAALVVVALRPALAAPAGEHARIAQALELRPGLVVADVGAGEGDHTAELARAVGETGRVLATEIEQRLLDRIAARMAAEPIANVETVLGDQQKTGLPALCCDRILLRLVYHHFHDTRPMRSGLFEALRPGGLILVVDVPPQKGWRRLEGVPERGGHGIRPEDVVREMRESGFVLVSRQDEWPGETDAYALVFRRP